MSPKDLRRPVAQISADVIGEILGDQPGNASSLPLDRIEVLPDFNPRTAAFSAGERAALFSPEALNELRSSMSETGPDGQPRGVLQPLLVRPLGSGRYGLVAGERRYHAARLAGLERVPVLIRPMSDEEALAAAIIENAQRRDLDPVSEAFAGFRIMTLMTGLDEHALVRHLNAVRQGEAEDEYGLDARLRALFGTGISTWSQQRARMLQLTEAERRAVQERRLDAKAVFPLLKLSDPQTRSAVLAALLALPERPSSSEAKRLVDVKLAEQPGSETTPARSDLATRCRQLAPGLRKLRGKEAARAEKLLTELQMLLS
jgi:ParB family transcriptional regulator, chromosome partitioning protein